MDETPEEMARIRREAEQIDVDRYRKRFRVLKAVGLGAALAGAVWLGMAMLDGRRNPCERVRDHFCGREASGSSCQMYTAIWKESEEEESAAMRSNIRSQCQSKITRLQEEEGIAVP